MSKDGAEAVAEEVKSGGVTSFIRGCNEELAKVVKPTFEETKQATWVTMVILMSVALALCLLDIFWKSIMDVFFIQ